MKGNLLTLMLVACLAVALAPLRLPGLQNSTQSGGQAGTSGKTAPDAGGEQDKKKKKKKKKKDDQSGGNAGTKGAQKD
jgi:hypothetical protein